MTLATRIIISRAELQSKLLLITRELKRHQARNERIAQDGATYEQRLQAAGKAKAYAAAVKKVGRIL